MRHGTRLKLNEIKALLDGLPAASSVSVVRPDDIIGALFSRAEGGTLVRVGERIRRYDSADEVKKAKVDINALKALLESAFGARLADGYFEKLLKLDGSNNSDGTQLAHLYVAESLRAAAVITRVPGAPDGCLYMDKLAVHNSFRGLGIAELLWQRICRDIGSMFWRSRSENSLNTWYYRQADGAFSSGEWTVFFYGLEHIRDSEDCVGVALDIPTSIERQQQQQQQQQKEAAAAADAARRSTPPPTPPKLRARR